MSGRVVHINDDVEGAVYIGRWVPRRKIRMSEFANPYRIGKNTAMLGGTVLDRQGAIEHYREELTEGPMRRCLAKLPELRDKPLACWCRHDGERRIERVNACHGDVLLELLERYTDDELRAMGGE